MSVGIVVVIAKASSVWVGEWTVLRRRRREVADQPGDGRAVILERVDVGGEVAEVAVGGDEADDAGLPSDPEFRAALVGYLEWGTRLAMHNSQPGADVVQQAPVPHWGWGAAPPYQP